VDGFSSATNVRNWAFWSITAFLIRIDSENADALLMQKSKVLHQGEGRIGWL
jgi:hypothetical protein